MAGNGYLIGYDIGSSSIKATLMEAETGKVTASAASPATELEIKAEQPGWAEQHPDTWWEHVRNVTAEIKKSPGVDLRDVKAVGIAYQMHGLVMVDSNQQVLMPSIIWCDSRAVEIGSKAFSDIGEEKCLKNLLNSPGNFTASKLKWVKDNKPEIYGRIHKIMLPGDFVAMKMTGEIKTTPSGLSEGIMWDFIGNSPADIVLDHYGFPPEIIPDVVPTFSIQGELTSKAGGELGIRTGTPVSYRAGDQPNNALSLNVLNPGEIAATAGTSGVVYGVGDKPNYDAKSRVNTFVHVNHSREAPRYGVLLCISGTGILNSWVKHNFTAADGRDFSYDEMNSEACRAPVGAGGLVILPYGNGAERTLGNKNIGASIHGLGFNAHDRTHVLRAVQEGIVFAFNYGMEIMKDMGLMIDTVRAGAANMFQSPLFCEAFATVTRTRIELFDTDGSQGAARGAGIGAGIYKTPADAFTGLSRVKQIEPDSSKAGAYSNAYGKWLEVLEKTI